MMLNILGGIYGKAANLRNALYEKGVFRSHRLPVPVISIGNITAGGTGKTPLVAFAAETLAEAGEKVCIVSRGYKREDEGSLVLVSDGEELLASVERAGDEPFELAKRLLGRASVVCDADRVRGGTFAVEKLGSSVIVLDDAFQHRRIRRDLDIVVIDATDPFGGGKMLPAGRLREPLPNLSRADVVVLNRKDLADDAETVLGRIREFNAEAPIFPVSSKSAGLRSLQAFLDNVPGPGADPAKGPFYVFCGIGNPKSFFAQLERENFELAGRKAFADHARYELTEIESINKDAAAAGAAALLTTAKDAVKLSPEAFELPCWILEGRLIIEDEPAFRNILIGAAND